MADDPIIIDMESAGLNHLAQECSDSIWRLARALVFDAAGEREMQKFWQSQTDQLEKFWWSAGR
jgi:hypothetical protein